MADYKWALTTAGSPPSGEGYESTTYTDVSTWSTAEGFNLTTSGDDAYLDAFDDWASGLLCAQEEINSSDGWVTDSSNFITLRVYDGDGHGGAIGGGFYAKDTGVGVYGAIRAISVRVDVIGWEFNSTAMRGYAVTNISVTPIIDKCIFVSTGFTGPLIGDNSNDTIVLNSLFVNGYRGADKVTLINCTIDNFSSYGFLGRNGTTIKNSIVTNSNGGSDPFYQEATGSNYNATDFSSTLGANSITSITVSDNYTAVGSDDYSIKDVDADIYDAGTDLSGTYPQLAYDIAGNPRSSTYSIGAYEWVSSSVDFSGSGTAGTGSGVGQTGTLTADFIDTGTAEIGEGIGYGGTLTAAFVGEGSHELGGGVGHQGTLVADFIDAGVNSNGAGIGQAGSIATDFIDTGTAGSGAGVGQTGTLALTDTVHFSESGLSGAGSGYGVVGSLVADFIDSGAAGSGDGVGQTGTLALSDTENFSGVGQSGAGAGIGQTGALVADFIDSGTWGAGSGVGQTGTLTLSETIHFSGVGTAGAGSGSGQVGTLSVTDGVTGSGQAGVGAGTGQSGSLVADFIDAGVNGVGAGTGQAGTLTTSASIGFSGVGQAGAGDGVGHAGTLATGTSFSGFGESGVGSGVGAQGTLLADFIDSGTSSIGSGVGQNGTFNTVFAGQTSIVCKISPSSIVFKE